MLEALLEAPEMSEIELFGAGVDPTNAASIGYLTAAGFIQQYREPDFEGMLYFLKRR
jgi:hypothetical protein